jgi:hypothetical protein
MHGSPSEDLLLTVLSLNPIFSCLSVCHPHVDALIEDEIDEDGKGCVSDLVEGEEDVIVIART